MAGRETAPSAGQLPPRIDLETCRREPAAGRGHLTGRIAFYSEVAGFDHVDPPAVSVMNADGSGVTHLRETNAHTAAWSPDGTRLAFVGGLAPAMAGMEEESEDSAQIFWINADGSGLTQITRFGPGYVDGPSWSPDGTRLAFVRDGDIHVINADGSGLRNLTNDQADDSDPEWSPDGGSFAFVSNRAGNSDIYVMNADGSGVRRLTNRPVPDVRPAWSPDGRRLAFLSQRDDTTRRDGRNEIHIVNADGSELTNLTSGVSLTNLVDDPHMGFTWSPDGRRLAVIARPERGYDMYIVNADGSRLTRYGFGDTIEPAWSPDGTMLAFVSNAGGNYHIYVMNADCSGLRNLTEEDPDTTPYYNHDHRFPTWLPANQQSSTQAPTGGARP